MQFKHDAERFAVELTVNPGRKLAELPILFERLMAPSPPESLI
jgi:hypothetical protein